MSNKYPSTSPYAYCRNNPLILYDPNGMFDDWVMDKYGIIYWDENAKGPSTTKFSEQYLGRAGQKSYGTAVVNYRSDGTWSFMDPVEISSNSNTPANISTNASRTTANVADWVCGNGKCLNSIGFFASVEGGMVKEAAASSEIIGKKAGELVTARMMGNVAKTAKCIGFAGEFISIAVAVSTLKENPNGSNIARLVVTAITVGSNGLNCVAPGFIQTKMANGISSMFDNDYSEKIEEMHPLGWGEAIDIANAIAFLLSDASKWTTGAVFNVDGGFTAQ